MATLIERLDALQKLVDAHNKEHYSLQSDWSGQIVDLLPSLIEDLKGELNHLTTRLRETDNELAECLEYRKAAERDGDYFPFDEEEPDHSIHYGDGRDFDEPYPPEDDPSYLT